MCRRNLLTKGEIAAAILSSFGVGSGSLSLAASELFQYHLLGTERTSPSARSLPRFLSLRYGFEGGEALLFRLPERNGQHEDNNQESDY